MTVIWGDTTDWLMALGLMAFALYAGIKSSWIPPRPKPYSVVVTADDQGFTAFEVMTCVSVRWADIARVTLIATGRGPWRDGFFYHVSHAGGDVTLPAHAIGTPAFVESLRRHRDFDSDAFEQAIRSASTDTFVVIVRGEDVTA